MSTLKKIVVFLSPFFIGLFVTGLVTSCATKISPPIDEQINEAPTLNLVLQNIDAYIDRRVRWGGVIANVINEKDSTILEIVDHQLNKQGKPQETDQTQGRFLAKVSGFLDPMIYAKGREITVVGAINKESKRLISQFEYTYPEIIVDAYKLWQVEKQIEYYYEPYWYGPWYPRHRWSPYNDYWRY